MTTIISAETGDHYKIIADLAKKIWTQHYTSIIGEKQVAYMLDRFQSVLAIKDQIKNGALYYLFSYQDKPVGYFSFNKKEDFLFISKLYVLNSVRGNGIGRAALSFIEAQAKDYDFKKIQLTVNKLNTNSIKAYEKMGFVIIQSIVQQIGKGYVMDDYVLEKYIN